MLISNKLHSFRNFTLQIYEKNEGKVFLLERKIKTLDEVVMLLVVYGVIGISR